jgi:hypothetical protein
MGNVPAAPGAALMARELTGHAGPSTALFCLIML